jgi:hypothetical protein
MVSEAATAIRTVRLGPFAKRNTAKIIHGIRMGHPEKVESLLSQLEEPEGHLLDFVSAEIGSCRGDHAEKDEDRHADRAVDKGKLVVVRICSFVGQWPEQDQQQHE